MKLMIMLLLVTALFLGLGVVATADAIKSSTATATAPSIFSLSVSTDTIDFGTLNETDYSAGYKELASAQQLTIKSNCTWVLYVKADTANFSYTGGATGVSKPCADLNWESATAVGGKITAASTAYTGLTTADAQVAAGNPGGNITVATSFKLLLSYDNDPPGNYSLGITYTLTAP